MWLVEVACIAPLMFMWTEQVWTRLDGLCRQLPLEGSTTPGCPVTCPHSHSWLSCAVLEVHQFSRDASVAEAWLLGQEPYLSSREIGQSVDEVEKLIKRHEAFEKSAATWDERFSALERLTTVSDPWEPGCSVVVPVGSSASHSPRPGSSCHCSVPKSVKCLPGIGVSLGTGPGETAQGDCPLSHFLGMEIRDHLLSGD